MSCIAGDLKLSGKGPEQVEIGSFGISGGNLAAFGLSLNVENGGKVHVISTSLLTLPLHPAAFHVPPLKSNGMSYASYDIRDTECDLLRSYGGTTYRQHFSPLDIDPKPRSRSRSMS